MVTCPSCGHESPAEFAFCPACGSSLTVAAGPREVRKVVTVLFCDLTGSTELGDRTDPESLRALMRRYYETARTVLERHGGTVEKFVGDAVMAVFGIPIATEDDGLRAVRAAVELRDTVHQLGLDGRIGVNTGEVVAGEGDTLVTGDAVNVAARLEQAAGSGEILLGNETLGLVRDAVEVEPIDLTLKGKAGTTPAHRLLALRAAAPGIARHLERPMVGRGRESARLLADFEDAAASRSSRLFSLIGPAGVGKSRLVADFLERIAGRASVARGRALSYGEGITYLPLVQMLSELGIDPDEAIRSSPADTQLATRALFERAAEEQPLVLVFDDLQWAEPALFDLIEHITDWSRDAPILLLCIGRPELLDARPGWGGGKLNATSLLLEPLSAAESADLADTLLVGIGLDADSRGRIIEIADGNPLFLEEFAALAREAGSSNERISIPPTIHAVLQARLDALSEHERKLLERGAVEGKVFHRGSVTELAPVPGRERVPETLLALVRKELVRPDRSQIAGDDAFRFRHLLIRDTAYESLPKSVRADLHRRFAVWLDAHGDVYEQDEIVGYHLEQAARYLRELNVDATDVAALADAAGTRLTRAGNAAMARGDTHAAVGLLRRGVGLLMDPPKRRRALPRLIDGLINAGELAAVPPLLEELKNGDGLDGAMAEVIEISIDPLRPGRSVDEPRADIERARKTIANAGDLLGLIRCDHALSAVEFLACRADRALQVESRQYEELRGADVPALQVQAAGRLAITAIFAGIHVAEVRSLLSRLAADLKEHAGPLALASLAALGAPAEYMSGAIDEDELRLRLERYADLLRQTGSTRQALGVAGFLVVVAVLKGDFETAERMTAGQVADRERIGDSQVLVNAIAGWALALARVNQLDAALREVARGRAMGRADDISDEVSLDLAEARARAGMGEFAAARALVDRARHRFEGLVMWPTEFQIWLVDAEVRAISGEAKAARDAAELQVARMKARGFDRAADQHRALIESLITSAGR